MSNHKSLYILYSALILPYLNYCSEVWSNTYKGRLLSLSLLAIRMIHTIGYGDHSHFFFSKSKILQFIDLVHFQTAQIMYKTKKILPGNIQKKILNGEERYNLRRKCNFKHLYVCTTLRSFCISVCGVKLWNRLSLVLKQCPSVTQFKKQYKRMVLIMYMEEERIWLGVHTNCSVIVFLFRFCLYIYCKYM